jgi:hypothetical protein
MGTESWIFFNKGQQDRLTELCPVGEFRVLSPADASGFLPPALTSKFDSIVVAASGSSDGNTYYLLNGNRWDVKAGEIDQQPFGIAMTGGAATSGVLVHHGDWVDRSTVPPTSFVQGLSTSGLGACYPLPTNPPTASGPVSSLPRGHAGAFADVVARIVRQFPACASEDSEVWDSQSSPEGDGT